MRRLLGLRDLRALRALARVELRDLRRHQGRSLLVALLVAVPVAALVGGSALFATTQPTLAERRAQAMGSAALRFEWGVDRTIDEALALLPAGAGLEPVFAGEAELRAPSRRLAAQALALDPEGLAAGMVQVRAGRAPASSTEVALSPVLLAGLGRALGETVRIGAGAERTVVGAVVAPEAIDQPLALFPLDSPPPGAGRSLLAEVEADAALALATELRAAGGRAVARAEIVPGDGFESIVLFVVGGFGFFEAALVVAAAFAVGVRRRQRELGLLGATGAPAADLRAAILLSAAVLAALGCALGAAVGLGAASALVPFLDDWNGRSNGALDVSLVHTCGALVLGVASATAAAVLPVRGVTRLPVRVALAGRRPVGGSSGGWLSIGLALFGLGLALLVFGASRDGGAAGVGILAGSVLALLGLGACSPWLLAALARCAGPLPLAWRLAVRDAGRFRARNGPVVTAVLAALSITVLVATMLESVASSLDARQLTEGPARAWFYVLLALCVLTGLVVVLIATALSSVESAADARVLHTVGAAPGLLRTHAAARAGYLAFLGCALAIPAGLVPAAGLMRLADVELAFTLPWPEVLGALFLLPTTAFAVTWSAAALRARPVPLARSLD